MTDGQCNTLKIIIIVWVVLFCALPALTKPLPDDGPGYRLDEVTGKIKVIRNKQWLTVKKAAEFKLNADDALMVYPGSLLTVIFPDSSRKQYRGPLYTKLNALPRIPDRSFGAFFEKKGLWRDVKEMFAQEGLRQSIIRKGDHIDWYSFYDDIKPMTKDSRLRDAPLSRSTALTAALKSANRRFNAFSKTRLLVLRALIRKSFKQNKAALNMVFQHYEKTLDLNHKKEERIFLEDQLYKRFLPITVTIEQGISNDRTFSSKFPLYWAAFHFDGREITELTRSIDEDNYPWKLFQVKPPTAAEAGSAEKTGHSSDACIIIVGCTQDEQLENFSMENALTYTRSKKNVQHRADTAVGYGTIVLRVNLSPQSPKGEN